MRPRLNSLPGISTSPERIALKKLLILYTITVKPVQTGKAGRRQRAPTPKNHTPGRASLL